MPGGVAWEGFPRPASRHRRCSTPPHAVTFLPEAALPARGRVAVYDPAAGPGQAELPVAAASALRLPGGDPAHACLAVPTATGPALRVVPVRAIVLADALPALLAGPVGAGPAQQLPDTLRVWALAARLGLSLVRSHRIGPTLVDSDGGARGLWRALVEQDPDSQAALARLAAAMPRAGHVVARGADAVWEPHALLTAFLDAVADLAARRGARPPRPPRPRERLLPWPARWVEALADPADPSVPLRDDAPELVAAVAGWQAGAGDEPGGLLELHLRAPGDAAEPWGLELGLRTDSGTLLPAAAVWDADPSDAGLVAHAEALVRGLGRAARAFPPLDRALHDPAPEHVDLSGDEAWELIDEAAPLLAAAGVAVALPESLRADALRLRLRVGSQGVDAAARPDAEPAERPDDEEDPAGWLVDSAGPAPASWELALGDETLTAEELDALLSAGSPLLRWRGRWLRVDPGRLARCAALVLGDAPPGQLPLLEALGLGLAGGAPAGELPGGPATADRAGSDGTATPDSAGPGPSAPPDGPALDPDAAEVVADGSVAALLSRLRAAAERPPVPTTPAGFTGELRGYQRRGVAWLQAMGDLGLGAVLADQMGLGKTVQLIAHLLGRAGPDRPGPFLIVCPTSVVGNWERELRRFAPGLRVTRQHGPDRPRDLTGTDGVVLTSYGTLRRDIDLLAAVRWDVVTLDEAQHVKNPDTAAAQAVRRLRSRHTVALTGTPLENRLAELWSLLDVTNPGLLGTRARFGRRFVVPIEGRRDRAAAGRLRRLTAPFVLRRVKADPAVGADLPDKIERTVVCSLTPEQAGLYRTAVERVFGLPAAGAVAGASPMQRRGRILALLTALKQVCNHPAQYRKEETPALAGRSGKLAAAREIVAEAVDAGEQVLVFTQFVAMGRLLVAQLSADLGVDVPFLHGAVPAVARDRLVAAFQGELLDEPPAPVLVVSLRAGGTGLNLTAATQVVHYDRWWNPAVEDQATDRTHRIGQTRTVAVHRLVTAGTVEERIGELLERKRALAEAVVGSGESWITELGDAELRELVGLSADARIEDLEEPDPATWEPGAAGRWPPGDHGWKLPGLEEAS